MKIAVIGANGQLGQDVCLALEAHGHYIIRLSHAEIEIRDACSSRAVLGALKPDCVVNTAAMLQVDLAENEPELAFAVNALGVRNLAQIAGELDFTLVEFSTDYVFDGAKEAPYLESDATRPLSVYGASKLAGENFVRSLAPRHFVVRVSGIYGTAPCRGKRGENFVLTMLRLAFERARLSVVHDEILTPSYTGDIAEQLSDLLSTEAYGLYHMTAGGACSWYEFTQAIFSMCGIPTPVDAVTHDKFPTKAIRPRYSVLDNAALRDLGIERMPPWQDGLARYLSQITGKPVP